MFIKNDTVFLGKVYLTLEKPDAPHLKDPLNKIHIATKYFNLVSRVKNEGYDMDKINTIQKRTNLNVLIGGWKNVFDAEGNLVSLQFEENQWDPNAKLSQIICTTPSGEHVGDVEKGWWFLKNGLVIDYNNPNIAYQPTKKSWLYVNEYVAIPFTYGDKVFDKNWKSKNIDDIPFIKRGDKTISSLDEAKEAAIKLSEFINEKQWL